MCMTSVSGHLAGTLVTVLLMLALVLYIHKLRCDPVGNVSESTVKGTQISSVLHLVYAVMCSHCGPCYLCVYLCHNIVLLSCCLSLFVV